MTLIDRLERKGIDWQLMFNKEWLSQFNSAQVKQLWKGYYNEVNFAVYAHPEVSSTQMLAHRLRLQGVA